jgi:predicted naringenin-chalcone synthase
MKPLKFDELGNEFLEACVDASVDAESVATIAQEVFDKWYAENVQPVIDTVNQQAEDEALWIIYPLGEQSISEAYIQQELRGLHRVIEGGGK